MFVNVLKIKQSPDLPGVHGYKSYLRDTQRQSYLFKFDACALTSGLSFVDVARALFQKCGVTGTER